MQFAEGCLTDGKSDLSQQPRYSNCMVRIPDTYNMASLSKGMSLEESRVKILQEWDGNIIDINPLIQEFKVWLTQQWNKKEIKKKWNHSKKLMTVSNKSYHDTKDKSDHLSW